MPRKKQHYASDVMLLWAFLGLAGDLGSAAPLPVHCLL